MDAPTAADLIRFLEEAGIEVYVDGGWAVDALLGRQTRVHNDIGIAVPHHFVLRLRALLAARGFRDYPRDDTWECNFVLADDHGCRLDLHSYTLDDAGKNIYGVAYLREHLAGQGSINGYPVRCVSPKWLVKFHTGYELDENDYHDVRLLCERFGIDMPDQYRKLIQESS